MKIATKNSEIGKTKNIVHDIFKFRSNNIILVKLNKKFERLLKANFLIIIKNFKPVSVNMVCDGVNHLISNI